MLACVPLERLTFSARCGGDKAVDALQILVHPMIACPAAQTLNKVLV